MHTNLVMLVSANLAMLVGTNLAKLVGTNLWPYSYQKHNVGNVGNVGNGFQSLAKRDPIPNY